MTAQEKKQFIEAFMSVMKAKFLDAIWKIPDDWDGFELRWLIADAFAQEQMGLDDRGRRKAYHNAIMVNNIL